MTHHSPIAAAGLAIIVSGLVFGSLGFLLGKDSKLPTDTNSSQIRPASTTETATVGSNGNAQQIDDGCSTESCLYSAHGQVVGFTRLKGFFTSQQRSKAFSDTQETVTCDTLTILSDKNALVQDIIQMTKSGNTVNSIDSKSHLALNLNLESLSEAKKQMIKNSSEASPVELAVIAPAAEGRGVDSCYSFVDIIDVK